MKVAIPLEIIDSLEMTGCQYYAWYLVQKLLKRKELDLTAIISDRTPIDILPKNLKIKRHPQLRGHGATLLNSLLFSTKYRNRFDIIHCPTVTTPFYFKPKAPVVMTVHDLVPLIHPRFCTLKHRIYFQYFVGRQIKKADHLIAVSETTKHDLLRAYDLPSNKVTVIPEGVDKAFQPVSGPKEDFVLSVATREPRKNLKRLIDAFLEMKRSTGVSTRLLLAGKNGWKQAGFSQFRNQLKSDVVFLGYVDRRVLIELYQKASAFIYPSFYEGFGLPVLEAMACGCPVVASNRASLPEVAGRSCLYVNPARSDDIAEALLRILSDSALASDLTKRGLKQAKRFTWDACAQQTAQLYRRIA